MTSNSETQDKELNIADILAVVLGGWKILLVTTFLGCVGGFLVARWLQPVYQADALLEVDTDKQGMSGSMGELQDLFGTSSKAETEIEILQSRMVLMPVVDSLKLGFAAHPRSAIRRLLGTQGRVALGHLMLPPSRKGAKAWTLVGRDSAAMLLVSPDGDARHRIVVGQDTAILAGVDTLRIRIDSLRATEGEVFELAVISDAKVAAALRKSLSVAEKGKKTGVVQLSYRSQYPDLAASVLNEITRTYLQQNIDAKSAEAQKTLAFLKEQLPTVRERLGQADSALNVFRQVRGTVDLSAEAQLALDQQVKLQQQLLQQQQQKQELLRLYEEGHPQVNALNSQMDRIKTAMSKSLSSVKALPSTQQEVVKLTRDVTVAQNFYQTMLDKIQQLEVVRAGEVGSARIIDLAQIPEERVKPNRKLIFLLGLAGGFAVGMGFLLFRRTIDIGVRDATQLEKLAEASVFAQVPQCEVETKSARKSGVRDILVHQSPDDLGVEALRSLRTALEFSLLGQGGSVLAITGITPGVGKSFVSVNLAALFALSGKRVILIDADLRKGRLHNHFDGQRAPGLSDFLSGRTSLEEVARQDERFPGMYFIPTGKVPPNPSEMLGSAQLGDLLQRLKADYDLVIIDTPPVLLVTDPTLVMRHADHATMIVEFGSHAPSDIQEAMKRIRIRGDLGVSLVLNKCQDEFGGYGGYGKYGRYSRYGKYTKYGKYAAERAEQAA